MSVHVNVIPKEFVKTYDVDNVEIIVTKLNLGISVEVLALLRSSNESVDSRRIVISGEEYDNWGQSDQYLVNLILNKLGLTPTTNQ